MTLSADNKSQFPFLSTDRLRDLISQNNRLLTTISHFGISLGFGDSTVADVCRKNNVDVPTFLTVSNFLSQRPYVAADVKVAPLMEYLKGTHSFHLYAGNSSKQLPMEEATQKCRFSFFGFMMNMSTRSHRI